MAKKTYRSMQGKEVDMDALRIKNELTVAVGNADMNARGDKLGPGGKIVRKREEAVAEYYDNNPNARPQQKPVTKPAATKSHGASAAPKPTSAAAPTSTTAPNSATESVSTSTLSTKIEGKKKK